MLLTLLLHGHVIFNGFAGDDSILFLNNTFYSSFSNIGMLFTRDYTTDPEKVLKHEAGNKGSGSIAYRPVLSATFFIDMKLWGGEPWGFHFTNLLLHVLNTLLVFFVLSGFFISGRAAFVAAILFSVHPVQSEAVAAIGYRGDLLVTFFSLVALGSWCLFRSHGSWKWAAAAGTGFFLAVFSKEAALLLPLVFLVYDRFFPVPFRKRTDLIWFLMCGAVMALYLYCYIFLFPNQTVTGVWGGWSWQKHAGLVLTSLGINLQAFLLPADLISFPGLYLPRLLSLLTVAFWGLLFLSAGYIVWLVRGLWLMDRAVFWGVWFFIAYLPVSNIIPTWNPVALRFLYMPGIAVWVLMGVLCDKALAAEAGGLRFIARWGMVLFMGLCCIASFYNERLWRDNKTIGLAWIARYPRDYKGYEVAGEAAANMGHYDDAIRYNELAIALFPAQDESPSAAVIGIVKSYLARNDVMSAELYLHTYSKPKEFPVGMFLLALIDERKGDVSAALNSFAAAVERSSYSSYGANMIRLSLEFSDYTAATWALDKEMARADTTDKKAFWQNLYAQYLDAYVYDGIQEVCPR